MKVYTGNIWNLYHDHWIVIPTNAGWNSRCENVMGRGLAKEAAKRFPGLALEYGRICRASAYAGRPNELCVIPDQRLILFPVKPLLKDTPQLSWNQKADIALIEHSALSLRSWLESFGKDTLTAIPVVGCGNGQLDPNDVLPILAEHLSKFENVVLVRL